jgi:hypothetical protein
MLEIGMSFLQKSASLHHILSEYKPQIFNIGGDRYYIITQFKRQNTHYGQT